LIDPTPARVSIRDNASSSRSSTSCTVRLAMLRFCAEPCSLKASKKPAT
jgi:hypothetical protein